VPDSSYPAAPYTLALLKVAVHDVDRAAAFDRDVLAMTPAFVAPAYGWAQFTAGDLALARYVPGRGGGDGHVGRAAGFHLVLPGVAFDDPVARARAHDAMVDGRVHQRADGTTFVDVRDPDGTVVKVFRGEDA
jgi:hypothetical protein